MNYKEFIIWFAGFWEGEGSGCYKKECTKKICKDILPYLRIR
jgi:hypothetical protein